MQRALVAGAALFVAPVDVAQDGGWLDPGAADVVDTASYFLITGGIMVASLFVLATSLVGLRTRLLPGWLAWSGIVVAPIVFLAPLFFPVVFFLAWLVAVSALLLARGRQTAQTV